MKLLSLLVVLAFVLSVCSNPVVDWNEELQYAIAKDNALIQSHAKRNMAYMHNAIYGALKSLGCYRGNRNKCDNETATLAIGFAGHYCIKTFYPAQVSRLENKIRALVRAQPDAEIVDRARRAGEKAAIKAMKNLIEDGLANFVDYFPSGEEGRWEPTPPTFDASSLPSYANETLMGGLDSPADFVVPPPPAFTSASWVNSYAETKALGSSTSGIRTINQTYDAYWWAGLFGTSGTAGLFARAATDVIMRLNMDMFDAATIMKIYSIAHYDSSIINFYWKYAHDTIRPVTAIREGLPTLNPSLNSTDPTWNPLLFTPPNSEYPCGHCTLSAASSRILELLFGADNIHFSITSDPLPLPLPIPLTKEFDTFSEMAWLGSVSRIYGGIHFRFAAEAGIDNGREIADAVFENLCPDRRCLTANNREITSDD